jgi:hypothetical protein
VHLIRTTGEKALHSVYSVSSSLFIGKDSGISPMIWGQYGTRRTVNGKLICVNANASRSRKVTKIIRMAL